MNITGIITEYNPFHLGHLYHLTEAKKDTCCDGVICVMSGNFVQRGMPALIDKWQRAEIAVKNGVDLVIELPLIFSISSAEGFSHGAVSILNSTNVVNNVYFGSEHGDVSDLIKISSIIVNETSQYKEILKEELFKGLPYYTARVNALKNSLDDLNLENILSNSNNILGIEYLKALIRLNSTIKPYTLKRVGSNYNDENITSSFASATSIRKVLESDDLSSIKDVVPRATYDSITKLKNNNYTFVYPEHMFKYLKYKILTDTNTLSNIPDIREGLENKIKKEILHSNNFNELILNIKSKRYTYTTISRILTSFFIGLENYNVKELLKTCPNYIRPLAFNETGREILKKIKENENIKIINKLPKNIDDPILQLDLLGTKAYSILNTSISPMEDYLRSPLYIK